MLALKVIKTKILSLKYFLYYKNSIPKTAKTFRVIEGFNLKNDTSHSF